MNIATTITARNHLFFLRLRRTPTFAAIIFAACALSACAVKGKYDSPRDTIRALSSAVRDDSRAKFIGALSNETRQEYEYVITSFWNDVRANFLPLAGEVEVVEVADYQPAPETPGLPKEYVWPSLDKPAKRAKIRVGFEGRIYVEDFLFVQQPLEKPSTSEEGKTIEYKTWVAVYPYYPFQNGSDLATHMNETLNKRHDSKPGQREPQ